MKGWTFDLLHSMLLFQEKITAVSSKIVPAGVGLLNLSSFKLLDEKDIQYAWSVLLKIALCKSTQEENSCRQQQRCLLDQSIQLEKHEESFGPR